MKNDSIDQIIAHEKELAIAHLTLELGVFERLLHPDYVILQADGSLETKSDVLESYQTGNRHWDKAEVNEMSVIVHDHFARVIGTWTATGVNNRQAFDYRARFISIWIHVDDKWQNISYQSTEIE